MKQHHGPEDKRLVNAGVNTMLEGELFDSAKGLVYDALNMRPNSMSGAMAAQEKYKGEILIHPNEDNKCTTGSGLPLNGEYKCIGNYVVNEFKVEFWADKGGTFDPLVRIDGLVVLMSSDFPITWDHPLQIDADENCKGGEIFITDFNVTPMLFNIEDLLENSGQLGGTCTEKYFDEFNLDQHTLTAIATAQDIPVFVELVDVGSGGGKPVGYYQYAIREATAAGDRTKWSQNTPLIPVFANESSASTQYPFNKTYSSDPAPSTPTEFGIKLRFRITNLNNFEFIEIRRLRYDAGGALGTLPIAEILDLPASDANMFQQEISVREFTDVNAIGIKADVPDEDPTEFLGVVDKAKSLRYYNNKLYLFNIKYASRDIDDDIDFLDKNGNILFPNIEAIEQIGFNDPHNYAYKKSYMGGEKYPFGVVGFDANGENTFVKKIEGVDTSGNDFQDYLYPNRREELTSDPLTYSYYGSSRAANTDGAVTQTHEAFSHDNAVDKTNQCDFHNIRDGGGGKTEGKLTLPGCTNTFPGSCKTLGLVQADSTCVGYTPFDPVSFTSSDVTDHNYRINHEVDPGSGNVQYSPNGFGPDYYSKGMTFAGIDTIPESLKAFSVVRGNAATRVKAQGIGFYSLVKIPIDFIQPTGEKALDELWFHSDDIAKALFNVDDILNSPTDYQVQLVSPLGFFSEVYNHQRKGAPPLLPAQSSNIDMVSYARIIKENGTINVGDSSANVGIADGGFGYTAYGKWRTPTTKNTPPFPNNTLGNTIFDIDDFDEITTPSGNSTYYRIKLKSNIYYTANDLSSLEFNDSGTKEFHEPVYIVNIIQDGVTTQQGSTTDFLTTGHYQKVDSIIGRSSSAENDTFILVDERWEDCIQATSGMISTPDSALNRTITIRSINGIDRLWINVTLKSDPDITTILTDITNTGSHTTTDGITVVGIYVSEDINDERRFFNILTGPVNINDVTGFPISTLQTFDTSLYIPEEAELLFVKYDNRIPIRFYGGDITSGESIFAPIDNEYGDNGEPISDDNFFQWGTAMPYRTFEINPRVYIINNTKGIDNIENNNTVKFSIPTGLIPGSLFSPGNIRQYCVVSTTENRIDMSLAFGIGDDPGTNFFPQQHYVMRPNKWDSGDNLADNDIFTQYGTDYGALEIDNWGFGGFRFKPQSNTDYSQEPIFNTLSSKQTVGFEEISEFCTRAIWSLERNINVQDSPSLRTFPANNTFDISDNSGEIKYAWDGLTNTGSNLYVFTEKGICQLIVDKRIISELSGQELATVGTESTGIQQQIWITRNTGINDEMWRTIAENAILVDPESGVEADGMFFTNKDSVFFFNGGRPVDLGRRGYHNTIQDNMLSLLRSGFSQDMTAYYDTYYDEYHLLFDVISDTVTSFTSFNDVILTDFFFIGGIAISFTFPNSDLGPVSSITINQDLPTLPVFYLQLTAATPSGVDIIFSDPTQIPSVVETLFQIQPGELWEFNRQEDNTVTFREIKRRYNTFVWSQKIGNWTGRNDYIFDRIISFNNTTFGVRNLETYQLDQGRILNGSLIEGELIPISSAQITEAKEFIRVRVDSDNQPVRIDFFEQVEQIKDSTPTASIDALADANALRDYDGFEQFVPRKTAAPNDRHQGRILFYKIVHNLDEDFIVKSIETQYKLLK